MKKSLVCILITLDFFAAPSGLTVIAGDVQNLAQQGNEWVIQSGHQAIVQWDQFSIAKGETVRFQQLNSSSSILNRVTGSEESHLLGSLISNGNVYLINPHGLFIGRDAYIEAASFIGASLDVLDQDFLEQKSLLFSSPGKGTVINLGTISCSHGSVFLFGRMVENQGVISAKEGQISLVVGNEVILQPEDRPTTLIKTVLEGDPQEGTALIQKGRLEAFQIALQSGSTIYTQAIHCSGVIEATSIREVGGQIELFAPEKECKIDGSLSAKSENGIGGKIHILGENIEIAENGRIDASGKAGGGQVLIGGDYRGSNQAIPNAKRTYIHPNAEIHADALETGKGGKVIVWSQENTTFLGQISASGGSLSGDGGFVEVSGGKLVFEGEVKVPAPFGQSGQLLIDPTDITISTAIDTGGFLNPCSGGHSFYSPDPSATDFINVDTLTYLLGPPCSCNVLISTSGSVGAGTGAIRITHPIVWDHATTLTLAADDFINISTNIENTSTTTGFTPITLQANRIFFASGSSLSTVGGNISLEAPLTLNTNATVSSTSGNITFTSTVDGAHEFTVNSGTGTATFSQEVGGTTPLSSFTVTAGAISTYYDHTTTGAMRYNGPVIAHSSGNFTNSGSGGIYFSSTLTGSSIPLTLSAPNTTIEVVGAVATNGTGAGIAGQNFTASAGSNVLLANIDTYGGTGANGGEVVVTSSNGSITVGRINSSAGSGGQAGLISLQPASGYTSGVLGNLPNGKLILTGDLIAAGGSTGSISLASTGRAVPLSIASITSSLGGNDITIQGASLTMGPLEAFTILGRLEVTTSGAISVRDIVASDSITLTANSITLNGRGTALLLDYLGALNESFNAHLIGRTAVNLNSGSQSIDGDITTFDTYTKSFFETLLVYTPASSLYTSDPLILNLNDSGLPPPPPPSPSGQSRLTAPLSFIMPLIIANTQLEEYLPSSWHRPFLPPEEKQHIKKRI